MVTEAEFVPASRGRGRPVGADSAETRARLLRAAREVIVERGYEAATFQAIALRAGLSRPAMHYYFHTREEVYHRLMADACAVVARCVEQAMRKTTVLERLTQFLTAAHRLDVVDRSMMRFIVSAHLESHRHPGLRGEGSPVTRVIRGFFASAVADAVACGALADEVEPSAVVDMLVAMLWGMGFHAGFIDGGDPAEAGDHLIAKQLGMLFSGGLLGAGSGGVR